MYFTAPGIFATEATVTARSPSEAELLLSEAVIAPEIER
jgi:hypothetical protein